MEKEDEVKQEPQTNEKEKPVAEVAAEEPTGIEVTATTVEAVPPARSERRGRLVERMKTQYPEDEVDYDDDEKLMEMLERYAGERDERIKKYEDDNKKLFDAFDKDKRFGQLIASVYGGEDAVKSFINAYGGDLRKLLDDPEYIEEMRKREADDMALSELVNSNRAKYADTVKSFMNDKEMDDEQQASFNDFVADLLKRTISFDFEGDTLERLYKAYMYDKAVEEARAEGEVAGRNENIEIQKREMQKGDGVPQPESSGLEPMKQTMQPRRKHNIWNY